MHAQSLLKDHLAPSNCCTEQMNFQSHESLKSVCVYVSVNSDLLDSLINSRLVEFYEFVSSRSWGSEQVGCWKSALEFLYLPRKF